MRILVLGSGFVASSIVQKLESEGHELLVFSRTPGQRIDCRQIKGDIFNFKDFENLFLEKFITTKFKNKLISK